MDYFFLNTDFIWFFLFLNSIFGVKERGRRVGWAPSSLKFLHFFFLSFPPSSFCMISNQELVLADYVGVLDEPLLVMLLGNAGVPSYLALVVLLGNGGVLSYLSSFPCCTTDTTSVQLVYYKAEFS